MTAPATVAPSRVRDENVPRSTSATPFGLALPRVTLRPMTDDDSRSLVPGRYQGAVRSAPYPLSRMAPAFDLVNVAAEIQRADAMLATVTGGKLEVIAEQIRALQDKARSLLEKAQRDAELHRIKCNFEKKIGGVYHLYREADGARWFSMIAPGEWRTPQTHAFEGTYRLDHDMSFERVDVDR